VLATKRALACSQYLVAWLALGCQLHANGAAVTLTLEEHVLVPSASARRRIGTLAPLRPRLLEECERDSTNRPSVSPAPPGFAERSNFPLRRRMAVRTAPMESRQPARPDVCQAASQNARSDHGWP